MTVVRHLYFDGKIQKASSGETFESIDPSNSQSIATVHKASESDIDAAIASARAAFHPWASTSTTDRSQILLRAVALLRQRNDEIARQETTDTGKPFSETSTVDVVTGTDTLEFYANLIASGGLDGETVRLRRDAWFYSRNEPLGVCAGIGAWNYPIQIALWKSAPCLAAGNTMVYKPSEFTPLHAQTLAEIFSEAGLPPGVFNVVQGAGDVGAYLTSHVDIAKVSFTGQVSTGKAVAAAAGRGMKSATLELGGKSPLIVLEDVDLDSAVDGAMMANFFSTGQVCTNGTRVFVPKSLRPSFEKRLLEKMKYVRMGDLMDLDTNFGPLVSKVHFDKVMGYVKHGIERDKATLLYGGLEPPSYPKGGENGFWMQPTIFTDCDDNMKIVQEEIFGPVMTILSYETIEEVIVRANATSLGLAAGVFTKNINLAHNIIDQLQAGITWINTWGESPAAMSVGGWKSSGLGVENGRKGLAAWTQNKSTLVENSGSVPTVFSKL